MRKIKIYSLLLLVLFFVACTSNNSNHLVIALSKGAGSEHYEQYGKWLKSFDSTIILVDLYYLSDPDSIRIILDNADGLVLTGGPDVHPDRYGHGFDTARCGIDEYRDTVEFIAIKEAEKHKLPILGICRGLQILNIYYGGTLFVDIPEDLGAAVQHRNDSTGYCTHFVKLVEGTEFKKIIKQNNIKVNSFHHQGINKLSEKFRICSKSDDGLPESIEWKSDDRYIRAVQWHPEREDFTGPTRPLGSEFIDYCLKFRNLKI